MLVEFQQHEISVRKALATATFKEVSSQYY